MGTVRLVRSVLIVDDDDAVRGSFQRAFTREGKQVFTAPDASAALRIAREARPDLALVDLQLSDAWGIDVVEGLKAAVPTIEIALVSAYVSGDAANAAMQLGVHHVFTKPVSCSTILKQVEDGHTVAEYGRGHPTLAQIQWEHIMRVLHEAKGNVSEAARRLGIHRQGLQKRLRKRPPRGFAVTRSDVTRYIEVDSTSR